jgi:hypothetical protein
MAVRPRLGAPQELARHRTVELSRVRRVVRALLAVPCGLAARRPRSRALTPMPIPMPLVARPATMLAGLLLASAAPAQTPPAPAPAKPTVVDRALLEALFLGGVPAVDALEVDGEILAMAELGRGADGEPLAPRDALEALLMRVLRADLERRGAWLGDDAFERAYADFAQPYDKTPFTVRVVATKFKGYPSLESFRRRWRVAESFVRAQPADALGDAALAAAAASARPVLASVGIDVEWWEHEAPLQPDGRRDFAAANAAAARTLAALRARPADASDPLPAADGVRHERAGAAKRTFLNPLQSRLREGEYATLLRAGVVETWFAARPGDLVGPTRGADAVFVARVHALDDDGRKLDVADARTRALLLEVLRQQLVRAWVDEVLARAIVRLPPARPPRAR